MRGGNRTCDSCGQSRPIEQFRSIRGGLTGTCNACEDARRRRHRKPEPAQPRLLQQLRTRGRGPMTEQECAIVAAARVIAGRTWSMLGAEEPRQWAHDQSLHAALFAAGLHMLPGNYREAARVTGGVVIDVVPGDAGNLTARLLDLTTSREYGSTAHLLITDAWLPPAAVNEIERRAGRPIGVYPQNGEQRRER